MSEFPFPLESTFCVSWYFLLLFWVPSALLYVAFFVHDCAKLVLEFYQTNKDQRREASSLSPLEQQVYIIKFKNETTPYINAWTHNSDLTQLILDFMYTNTTAPAPREETTPAITNLAGPTITTIVGTRITLAISNDNNNQNSNNNNNTGENNENIKDNNNETTTDDKTGPPNKNVTAITVSGLDSIDANDGNDAGLGHDGPRLQLGSLNERETETERAVDAENQGNLEEMENMTTTIDYETKNNDTDYIVTNGIRQDTLESNTNTNNNNNNHNNNINNNLSINITTNNALLLNTNEGNTTSDKDDEFDNGRAVIVAQMRMSEWATLCHKKQEFWQRMTHFTKYFCLVYYGIRLILILFSLIVLFIIYGEWIDSNTSSWQHFGGLMILLLFHPSFKNTIFLPILLRIFLKWIISNKLSFVLFNNWYISDDIWQNEMHFILNDGPYDQTTTTRTTTTATLTSPSETTQAEKFKSNKNNNNNNNNHNINNININNSNNYKNSKNRYKINKKKHTITPSGGDGNDGNNSNISKENETNNSTSNNINNNLNNSRTGGGRYGGTGGGGGTNINLKIRNKKHNDNIVRARLYFLKITNIYCDIGIMFITFLIAFPVLILPAFLMYLHCVLASVIGTVIFVALGYGLLMANVECFYWCRDWKDNYIASRINDNSIHDNGNGNGNGNGNTNGISGTKIKGTATMLTTKDVMRKDGSAKDNHNVFSYAMYFIITLIASLMAWLFVVSLFWLIANIQLCFDGYSWDNALSYVYNVDYCAMDSLANIGNDWKSVVLLLSWMFV